MSPFYAAYRVLKEADIPLKIQEITDRALKSGLWKSRSAKPWQVMAARLYDNINQYGENSPFIKTGPLTFFINKNVPEPKPGEGLHGKSPASPSPGRRKTKTDTKRGDKSRSNKKRAKSRTVSGSSEDFPADSGDAADNAENRIKPRRELTSVDAAQKVLETYGNDQPMHYKDIADKAIEEGWFVTASQTPHRTMYANILAEIKRKQKIGEDCRFIRHGNGRISLNKQNLSTVGAAVERHNRKTAAALLERIISMSAEEFEETIVKCLKGMGFKNIAMSKTGEGSWIAKAELVADKVLKVRTVLHIKKVYSNHNMQSWMVRQFKNGLNPLEHGVLITTGFFSKGASREAERDNEKQVNLIDGKSLARLFMEHGIGTTPVPLKIYELYNSKNRRDDTEPPSNADND